MLIETERLRLCPLTIGDLDHLVELHAQPEVSRYMRPLSREQAAERLVANECEWERRGHGLLAIRAGDSGRFLGRTGLKYWSQFDETELGWVLHPLVWGYGYATEAAHACAAWGFRNVSVDYLTAMIRPENQRSIQVAERLHMSVLRDDVLLDLSVVVHSIRREDWSAATERAQAR